MLQQGLTFNHNINGWDASSGGDSVHYGDSFDLETEFFEAVLGTVYSIEEKKRNMIFYPNLCLHSVSFSYSSSSLSV